MKEEDVLALAKAIIEIGQEKNFGQHDSKITYAIDGVSESIEKLNSTLERQLGNIESELACLVAK